MNRSICGHDRETLAWALHTCRDERYVAATIAEKDTPNQYPEGALCDAAFRAVCDPAKLAAIIAELLRERGIDTRVERPAPVRSFVYEGKWAVITLHEDGAYSSFHVEAGATEDRGIGARRTLAMPQARAFALALLDSPEATAQDIERMIEEVTR